jgi:hypothetical protein
VLCRFIERLWFSTYKINYKATNLVNEGINTLRHITLVVIAYLSPIKPPKNISRVWILGHSIGSHILVTLLRFVCRVTRMSSQKFHQVPQGYRVIMLWVQGNQNVITSWYGLVSLLAPHCYDSHPLLTTYRIRYKVYISLNNEVNTLEYFNLAVIVR